MFNENDEHVANPSSIFVIPLFQESNGWRCKQSDTKQTGRTSKQNLLAKLIKGLFLQYSKTKLGFH